MASPDASAASDGDNLALLEQDRGHQRDASDEPSLALAVAHAVKRALEDDHSTGRDSKRARHECDGNDPRQRTRRVMARRMEIAQGQAARLAAFLLQRRATAWQTAREEEAHVDATATCTICLGALRQHDRNPDTQAEALPCGHVYHRRCIARWICYNRCCPIDRRPLD